MKTCCKHCGGEPKYVYANSRLTGRVVMLQCKSCGLCGKAAKSDPTAVKNWNEDNQDV